MILILGGGLAGLSTAYHLRDLPHLVLEAESRPGGLCRSRRVGEFVFDYTGHLLHLRDPRAIALVERWLPGVFRIIERRACIRTRGVSLPFPFQAHLHGLAPEVVADCIVGFVEASKRPVPEDPRTSFRDWSLAVLGRGISEAFMFPYNCKLFRRAPEAMTADWVSWAVPRPSLEEVVRGALGLPNRKMGYNATFRYPARGGIEVLVEAFAQRVPRVRLGARVCGVELRRRRVELEVAGRREHVAYEALVVTIPLPAFLRMIRDEPELPPLAERLDWTRVACWNLGVDRSGLGEGAHWIYFPDPDTPYYRVGFPTNFSDAVAPPGTSSLYVEFALRRDERFDPAALEAPAREALEREGILRPDDRIVASDWVLLDPGYVIFDWARQEVLAQVLPRLERAGVHCIGRYGAWTYSYMERAILDGMETAERLRAAAAVAR